MYYGGSWRRPARDATIVARNAATLELVGSTSAASVDDVDAAVGHARRAVDDAGGWPSWPAAERADKLEALAKAFTARADRIAATVTAQNGMPIQLASQLEAGMPAAALGFYADLIREKDFAPLRAGRHGGTARVREVPVGVVAGIVPWNFPQTLAFTKLAPALAAGCSIILKPSPETALDSMILADAIDEAGIPAGIIGILPGGPEVGEALVSHPGVDKVSFTGSTEVGRAIAERCGRLLRPVTTELGGKSAAVFLEDVDMSHRWWDLFGVALLNNGQTCYATTRLLVPRSRYDELVGSIAEFVGALNVGDPSRPETQVGPLVSRRQRDRVKALIATGVEEGGRVVVGGGSGDSFGAGWFVEPTVIADVDNGSTIARTEIFGPVLTVTPYADVAEAVRLANDTPFGLCGTVWTEDAELGENVAARLEAGAVGVNGYVPDPAISFGGWKASGLGRELGPEGLAGYLRVQSVHLGAN
ncbi:aldehyde dehydrogenase [Nocardioides sp. LMS-CY]|uniref:aldehyde dehydrogenase n=1 Tax=Nocardioides sp. (strain LMS-CY) TaxID=2840457 RepID=UPI001C0003DD|nr:aldehyde dehydrogenase [Nocardioides sp. LMS-CY]QWF22302.1 aldehyde dehydrogenase [Nocardioides sp. LMS-CY]